MHHATPKTCAKRHQCALSLSLASAAKFVFFFNAFFPLFAISKSVFCDVAQANPGPYSVCPLSRSLSFSPLPFLPAAFSLVRSLLNCVFFHRTREGLARRSVTACDFKQRPFRFLWEKEKNKFLRSRCRRQPDSRGGAGTRRCGFVAQVSGLDCFQMECGDFLDRGLSWKSFRRLFFATLRFSKWLWVEKIDATV